MRNCDVIMLPKATNDTKCYTKISCFFKFQNGYAPSGHLVVKRLMLSLTEAYYLPLSIAPLGHSG